MLFKSHKIYIFVFLVLQKLYMSCKADTFSDADMSHCKSSTTTGYKYTTIYRLPESSFNGNKLDMKFYVCTDSNAHILLGTTESVEALQPVYEIVIGGGRNTFSQIRRSTSGDYKTSVYSQNIVSRTEIRGFWISITQDGVIGVGKSGEDVPFMFWQDPEPLPVKYFSFSSWSNVIGKWFYDCNTTNDLSTEVKKNLTKTEQLRIDLLKGYDPQVIPKKNFDDRLIIYTKLDFRHIELDSKKGEIAVTGILGMTWTDEKLNWQPSKYGGIKSLQLVHGETWRPELVLYNAVEHGAEPLGISGVVVTAVGEVLWYPMTRLQAHCKLDLSSWPWDQHTCELQLGFWALKDFLKLVLLKNGTEVSNQKSSSGWKLLSVEAETTQLKTPWFDNDLSTVYDAASGDESSITLLPTDTAVVIKITVKRVSSIYTYVLLVPLIVTVIVSSISFGLSPVSPEKIGIQCICLLLGSMFIITVDNSLPSTAEHIPYIFKAYSKSMIMVSVSIAVSVFVMTIIRQPHYVPPPRLIITLLSWSPLQLLLCLPRTSSDGTMEESYDGDLKPGDPSYYWNVLATVLDRLTMFFTVIFIIHILVSS